MRIKVGYLGFEGTLTLRERPIVADPPTKVDGSMPGMIHAAVMAMQWDREKEHAWAVLLNQRSCIKGIELVSVGSLTSCVIHPREVFRPAIVQGAAAVVLVHNHPSGNPTPSVEDHQVTARLAEAGAVIGIRLVDHIVLGYEKWISFENEGWMRS